jgi:hypothetical protein
VAYIQKKGRHRVNKRIKVLVVTGILAFSAAIAFFAVCWVDDEPEDEEEFHF